MIDLEEAAPYVLRRGLLDASTFVDGEVRVEDHSRRNRALKVQCSLGPSLLLKHGLNAGGRATIAHEAVVYERLRSMPVMAEFVPTMVSYDAEQQVLALELIPDARNLRSHHLRLGRFPIAACAALGRTLGTIHSVAPEEIAGLPRSVGPWVLSIHRPGLDIFREYSAGGIELVKLIQRFPELGEALDDLRLEERATSLVHGDLRWENCVVRRSGRGRMANVKLVDWEAAGLGDPAWDLGCVFAEYLATWLLSLPLLTEAPDEALLELARYPLEKMQPAMNALWHAYAGVVGHGIEPANDRLTRSIRCSGARLIQVAFENVRFAPSLSGWVIYLVQLGSNILKRPHAAGVHLLGLSL